MTEEVPRESSPFDRLRVSGFSPFMVSPDPDLIEVESLDEVGPVEPLSVKGSRLHQPSSHGGEQVSGEQGAPGGPTLGELLQLLR